MKVKLGTLTLPNTSNATFAVTGVGFRPKLVIFLAAWNWSWASSANSFGHICYGAADALANQFAMAAIETDNYNPNNVPGRHEKSETKCIILKGYEIFFGGDVWTNMIDARLVSMDTDGFTLNVFCESTTFDPGGEPFPTDSVVQYLALGGDDLLAKVGNFTPDVTTTGNYSITDAGFRPKALMLTAAANTSAATEGHMGIGAGTSSTNRVSVQFELTDLSAAARLYGGARNDRIMRMRLEGDASGFNDADLVSLDGGGFTLNQVSAGTGGDNNISYIALGGEARFDVGRWTGPTAVGSQDVSAAVKPEALIVWGDGLAAHTDFAASAQPFIGLAVPGVANVAVAPSILDGSNPSDAATRLDDSKSLLACSGGAATLQQRGKVIQALENGFRIDWDTVDATARIFNFLAIQGGPTDNTLLGQACY